ncbi:invasion protein IalB [Palleronia aestuarii]|uniref:Invasion protein IalB n=1 Tax=Palleronia aestuarii TaxID=568105 RepID=A0A2W7NG75_9RHOB|nr:invasion associated locus B family protein [Palleronia aestuarii]PZX18493.1 invasion protein IalB [Palleronia aestuarii]
MSQLLKSISLMALVALAGPAFAQDDATSGTDAQDETTTTTPSTETGGADAAAPEASDAETEGDAEVTGSQEATDDTTASGLSMGEEVQDGPRPGQTYTAETFGDWQQRCIRTEDGDDPCQLYQLLEDGNGNAVAEITVVSLPEGQQAAAGATIITPLETLLTEQLTLAVDSAQPRRYPFNFCAEAGCFSRIGLTASEVQAMQRGATATLTIVPAAAPDQTIDLAISLSGFTAGYEAVREANAE